MIRATSSYFHLLRENWLDNRLTVETSRFSIIDPGSDFVCNRVVAPYGGMQIERTAGPMRCPECGTKIEVRHTHYPSFNCPSCDTEICVASRYLITLRLFTAILSFAGSYLVGLRGLTLILVGALASLVFASIATPIGLVVMPPRIEKF